MFCSMEVGVGESERVLIRLLHPASFAKVSKEQYEDVAARLQLVVTHRLAGLVRR